MEETKTQEILLKTNRRRNVAGIKLGVRNRTREVRYENNTLKIC